MQNAKALRALVNFCPFIKQVKRQVSHYLVSLILKRFSHSLSKFILVSLSFQNVRIQTLTLSHFQ